MTEDLESRPKSFTLDGEEFYIGSDVGNYIGLFRGTLYRKYPSLFKRAITIEEKHELSKNPDFTHQGSVNVFIVRKSEVNPILNGEEMENLMMPPPPPTFSEKESRSRKTSSFIAPVQSSSHHLEAVPTATPINRNRPPGKSKLKSYHLCLDDVDPVAAADNAKQPEILVPIRLDIEQDGVKLRDCFLWNRNERLVTLEKFAELLCDDLDLAVGSFLTPIVNSMKQQIDAFPSPGSELLSNETDQRVVIKLNIQIGNVSLIDQFEWDVSEQENSPEDFARQLCADLGLGSEFLPAIVYTIRGQISWQQHIAPFSDTERMAMITNPVRNITDLEQWGPRIDTLTDAEMAKKMKDQDRSTRRIRRIVNTSYY